MPKPESYTRRLRHRYWWLAPLACWAFVLFGLFCASQNMQREHDYHLACDAKK